MRGSWHRRGRSERSDPLPVTWQEHGAPDVPPEHPIALSYGGVSVTVNDRNLLVQWDGGGNLTLPMASCEHVDVRPTETLGTLQFTGRFVVPADGPLDTGLLVFRLAVRGDYHEHLEEIVRRLRRVSRPRRASDSEGFGDLPTAWLENTDGTAEPPGATAAGASSGAGAPPVSGKTRSTVGGVSPEHRHSLDNKRAAAVRPDPEDRPPTREAVRPAGPASADSRPLSPPVRSPGTGVGSVPAVAETHGYGHDPARRPAAAGRGSGGVSGFGGSGALGGSADSEGSRGSWTVESGETGHRTSYEVAVAPVDPALASSAPTPTGAECEEPTGVYLVTAPDTEGWITFRPHADTRRLMSRLPQRSASLPIRGFGP